MREVLTNSQMKAYDNHTICNKKVPSCVLMEKAALRTVDAMKEILLPREKEKILVVCGSGNNGGDGVAIARMLYLQGYDAAIYMAGNAERMTTETKRQWEIAGLYGVPRTNIPDWNEYTTIVDAIFGVGLGRVIEGRYRELIQAMNDADARKIAVDIPSGIHGDTGQVMGIAFRADLTVTFACIKRGLCLYPGRTYAGQVLTAEIGIYAPEGESSDAWYLEPEDLKSLPVRTPDGNKGTFGKVLAVAGSAGMCGAAFFAAGAALKTGAGMVKVLTEEENRVPLQILLPEAMISTGKEEEAFQKDFDWCDVLIIGPGLGTSEKSAHKAEWFLKKAQEAKKTVILDADGLNLLAEHSKWRSYLGSHCILTPHMGEMSRLTKKSISQIKADPPLSAAELASELNAVCVLKDACTVTASNDGRLFFNRSGNAGMATAGSGDVLSGILAGICCMYRQTGCEDFAFMAAQGVYLHGLCGDRAAKVNGTKGMTASDIIRYIPELLKEFEE